MRYPVDVSLNWDELLELVQASVPTGEPYHVVAESFSGPIAIRFAAADPSGLQSLVLCASFCRN
ncbi:MAG: alpha/beta hydrolase, partial [Planctomycetota bacterium]|nr:alpha/beta hydrolase [Planctomycetota bacterium]